MTSVKLLGVDDVLCEEHVKYESALKKAEAAFNEALDVFEDKDFETKKGWKKEGESPEHDIVYSKQVPDGKLFALKGEIPGNSSTVFYDNWTCFEEISKWNSNYVFTKKVVELSEHADIIHYGNDDMLIVKGRDFVCIRIHRRYGDGFLLAACSVELADIPETKSHVRGNLCIGAGRFMPKESDPNATVIDYILCVDLNGFIPKTIVNQVMARMMLNDLASTKKHILSLKQK
uniref:START domain-containing protein n=2 Tax=Parascaris univalens TaxID=6257 RepID=A0A915BRJ7_PARUN